MASGVAKIVTAESRMARTVEARVETIEGLVVYDWLPRGGGGKGAAAETRASQGSRPNVR